MPPDRWLALTVRITQDDLGAEVRDLLPEFLLNLGGGGVEETGDGLTTYLLPPPDLEPFLDATRARLAALSGGGAELLWSWQPHEDWEHLWRRGLGPRHVTPRIVVAPSWKIPPVDDGQVLIRLDPGMAFGTAEHATTRGCLRLLDPRVAPGDRLADIGAGSGILSIASAALGAGEVVALEVDPMACQVARENLEANGVVETIRVLNEEVQPGQPIPGSPFQGIVANIQRSILEPLLPSFRDSLVPEGWLILSGLLLEEKERLQRAAAAVGFVLDAEDEEENWWSGAFTHTGGPG